MYQFHYDRTGFSKEEQKAIDWALDQCATRAEINLKQFPDFVLDVIQGFEQRAAITIAGAFIVHHPDVKNRGLDRDEQKTVEAVQCFIMTCTFERMRRQGAIPNFETKDPFDPHAQSTVSMK